MGLLTKKQYSYLADPIFLQRYLSILNSRLVYNNNRIELNNEEIDQLYDHANILSLDDNLKAFNVILSKLNEKGDKRITQELIKTIANIINEHAIYISNNYRTISDNTKLKDKYPIEKASNIEPKMKELLDNYYYKWNNLDIFEREALFNIEFLRIHPFDDGNGRTSRLILNYNLFLNGHAPVLIPPNKREEYFDARNRQDVNWIKNLFEEESTKELKALDKLIESYELEKKQPKHKR
ncbi:MAG: Fic family protein [Bacilli bacterium]|nr:Fic family protein [Bacilli bacterium]